MDRRVFVTMVGGSIVTAPFAAAPQQPGKVWRIGVLSMAPSPETQVFEAFRKGLQELGYVEGKNISLDFRLSTGHVDRLGQLASELVRHRVDVIVTDGGVPTRAALSATKEIPIVIGTGVSDPVAQGFAKSLARPGGNVTGVTTIDTQVVGKQVELLREALPTLSRLAVLYNPQTSRTMLPSARVAASSLNLEVISVEAPSPDALPAAFQSIARGRPGAVLVLADRMLYDTRAQIVGLAAKQRLPLMGERPFPEAGALLSYGASRPDSYRLAATYVDKILKGAKPGDLPIQQPTKFELVINLKAAKALGLTIPQSILVRADEIIQ